MHGRTAGRRTEACALPRVLPAPQAWTCVTMFLTANMLKALIAKALSKHFHSRGYMERMQKAVRQVGPPIAAEPGYTRILLRSQHCPVCNGTRGARATVRQLVKGRRELRHACFRPPQPKPTSNAGLHERQAVQVLRLAPYNHLNNRPASQHPQELVLMALSRPCPGRSHEESATHMGLGYHIAHLFGHQPRSTKSYSTNKDCGPGAPGGGGGGGGAGGGVAGGTLMRSPFAHPEAHTRAGAGPDCSALKPHTSVPAKSFGPADGVGSASGVSGRWYLSVHALSLRFGGAYKATVRARL